MIVVLITLTTGCQTAIVDNHQARVCITVLPMMDLETHWNSTVQLLEQAYGLQEFASELFQNPKYCDYWQLFTTQGEWTIVRYVMGMFRSFRY
jgi:hypothetical protein